MVLFNSSFTDGIQQSPSSPQSVSQSIKTGLELMMPVESGGRGGGWREKVVYTVMNTVKNDVTVQ